MGYINDYQVHKTFNTKFLNGVSGYLKSQTRFTTSNVEVREDNLYFKIFDYSFVLKYSINPFRNESYLKLYFLTSGEPNIRHIEELDLISREKNLGLVTYNVKEDFIGSDMYLNHLTNYLRNTPE